ncbi:DUF2306 domain-containing protein [Nocardiopsis sp. LOL_012]|uniref:DUF2306 domain-containing protein n=1 Tax=Nocardiopsis sp. LOL_012 TaxID=3345409 RepID=UPI003A83D92D
MRTSTTAPPSRRRRVRTGLIAASSLCALTALFAATAYVGLDPAAARVPLREGAAIHYPLLLVHVVTSVLALATVPLQLWPALRRSGAHRVIGRIALFAGILPGAVSGFGVALLSGYGPVAQTGFAVLAVLWFTGAVAGYRAIRRGRRADHREWMVRVFALTFAAVTLRLWIPVLMVLLSPALGPVYGEESLFRGVYQTVAWLCWVPNLVIAEWYLRRSSAGRARAAASGAQRRGRGAGERG